MSVLSVLNIDTLGSCMNWKLAEVFGYLQRANNVRHSSAMSLQICPAMTVSNSRQASQKVESACHIGDSHSDHRCLADDDCGVDATTCRRRHCSIAGYCGLWLFV